jgi:competence protein ComEA
MRQSQVFATALGPRWFSVEGPQQPLSEQYAMFKQLLAAVLAFVAAAAFAAVDVNKASQAELEGIKGIGPAIAGKILDERKKSNFKDWGDLVTRVNGIGEGNAAKFSEAGLTVAGSSFKGVTPAAAPAKKEEKAAAAPAAAPAPKKEEKAMAAPAAVKKDDKPAAAAAAPAKAADAKPAAKEDPKAAKEAAAKAKDDEKAKAKAEKEAAAKAKADEKAKAKADKEAAKAKKDDKPSANADKEAKPAAAAASGAKK